MCLYSHTYPRLWCKVLLVRIRHAFTTYQYWVAQALNPQQYGQARHCYASAGPVQASTSADPSIKDATSEYRYLDMLTARLMALSNGELTALLARLDAKDGPTWAGTIRRMSDGDLDVFITTLGMPTRRPGWARRLMTTLRAHGPDEGGV